MYNEIGAIPFEGAGSKTPYSFRYYDKNRVIGGKTMAEHLRFAMSWWHTCNASGTDMFGGDTMDKTFGKSGIEMHKAKVDFAFDLMQKLGIEFYCFHDVDIAPEGATLAESIANVLGVDIYLTETEQGPSMGGALLAMVACGEYASVYEAADATVKKTLAVQCDPALMQKYDRGYAVYKQLYPALKSLYQN